jgi:hypothetical protein
MPYDGVMSKRAVRKSDEEQLWAVYEVAKGKHAGIRMMCRQSQWEAMAVSTPDANILIQGNIANEGEAEKLARGKSGDARPRTGNATPDDGRHVLKRDTDS